MNLKFSLIFFILVFYEGIEGGLVTLKEPPPVLNGRQIQHVLNSDRNGGVKYSNIPVYGREDKGIGNGEGNESKTAKLNKNVQDKVDKKSKKLKNKKSRNEKAIPNWSGGNPFAALEGLEEKWEKKENKKLNKAIEKTKIENNNEEKEEENCNQNCEEVVCEDELGEMKNGQNEARSENKKLYSWHPKFWSPPKAPSPPKSSDSSPSGNPTIIKPPSNTYPYGGSTYTYGGRYPYYYGGTPYYYGSSNSSNCCCKKRTIQAVVFGYLALSSLILMAPSFNKPISMNCVIPHGFNGGKQLNCELKDDSYYKCTNIMGDYPKELRSKGFNKGEYQLECPIGPNGSNVEVAKANVKHVEESDRNWFVQFVLDPVKNVTSGWNNTKV